MIITSIDFETANRSPASVCAVGISQMEDGRVEEKYYSLIRPEKNVAYFAPFNIQIHHITSQMACRAPSFASIYPELIQLLEGSLICAHNARFDMNCLRQTCWNTGLDLPHLHYFDTLQLSRSAFPQMTHHRLDDMCSLLNIDLDHHHAGSDAQACLMIVKKLMERTGIDDVEKLLRHYHTCIYSL